MDTLSFAAGMLNTVNPNLQDFQPRLCIVVTWIPINVLSEFSSVEVPVNNTYNYNSYINKKLLVPIAY